jgi:hypothetical protein
VACFGDTLANPEGDASGEDARLSRSRGGDDRERDAGIGDGRELLGIEVGIGGTPAPGLLTAAPLRVCC